MVEESDRSGNSIAYSLRHIGSADDARYHRNVISDPYSSVGSYISLKCVSLDFLLKIPSSSERVEIVHMDVFAFCDVRIRATDRLTIFDDVFAFSYLNDCDLMTKRHISDNFNAFCFTALVADFNFSAVSHPIRENSCDIVFFIDMKRKFKFFHNIYSSAFTKLC